MVVVVIIVSFALYIAFRPDGLSLFNTYVLKPFGVSYTAVEGSLSQGATWHNLHHETIDIKTLTLDYNLTAIIQGEHVIDALKVDGVQIHLDDFLHSTHQHSRFPLPHFRIHQLQLTHIQLLSAYPIELDMVGKNGSFDRKSLFMKNLTVTLRSRYAESTLHATITHNLLKAQGEISPNLNAFDPAVSAIFQPHYPIDELRISPTSIHLKTHYRVTHTTHSLQMEQTFSYGFKGDVTTHFRGEILSPSLGFPSRYFTGEGRGSGQGLNLDVTLDHTHCHLTTSDYDHFQWNFSTQNPHAAFLSALPDAIGTTPLIGQGQGEYFHSDHQATGVFAFHHTHADSNGSFQFHNDLFTLQAQATLPPDAAMWKDKSLKPPPHLHVNVTSTQDQTHVTVEGEKLAFSGAIKGNTLQGSGHYLATGFEINGSNRSVSLATTTLSLRKIATLFPMLALPNEGLYDGELHTLSHWNYDKDFQGHTTFTLPWYTINLDLKRIYRGKNTTFDVRYDAHHLILNHYALDVADHVIISQRPSAFHWDESGNITIDTLWLLDTLALRGMINAHTLETNLSLVANDFHYHGPEGDAHAKIDLQLVRDANATQKLAGNITFLSGNITYLPLQKIKVMDDDVIIVQEITPPSTSSLSMDVSVDAQKPLSYHTPEVDITLSPNFTLWKDSNRDVEVLGMVTFPSGTITVNNKGFILCPSHLYFGGELPFNPYLDLRLDHEVDTKKIQMYLTNRLDSPIFIFGSDPIMSQNEIMSYILFGSSSSASTDTSTAHNVTARADATNFMLGAGLKELIGGVTRLNIDTMNILTTKEGGMGFEVGARLAKDFRILYKNDAISSVLVQYRINQWLRLDADVHTLGQGINAIYIKDFYDLLPHNEIHPLKRIDKPLQ